MHFVIYDDQTNPQVAVQLTNQLIAKKAAFILGPDFSSTCRAVLPLVDQAGIVSYCLTAAIHPPKGSFMFANSVDTKDQPVATVRFLRERGWKRIAILTPTDSTGQDADQEFDGILALPENKSVEITGRACIDGRRVEDQVQQPASAHPLVGRNAFRHRVARDVRCRYKHPDRDNRR